MLNKKNYKWCLVGADLQIGLRGDTRYATDALCW